MNTSPLGIMVMVMPDKSVKNAELLLCDIRHSRHYRQAWEQMESAQWRDLPPFDLFIKPLPHLVIEELKRTAIDCGFLLLPLYRSGDMLYCSELMHHNGERVGFIYTTRERALAWAQTLGRKVRRKRYCQHVHDIALACLHAEVHRYNQANRRAA